MNKKDWPPGGEAEVTADFEGPHGDRRQELVFIGQFDDKSSDAAASATSGTTNGGSGAAVVGVKSKKALEQVLDTCLLTDIEMKAYEKASKKGEDALRDLYFPNAK